ncbi:hypothetical protein [Mesorhizobium amorphae]|uniref:hypothetical protein n=1 Tax=Mesorhizobium amorphae TaxID=71433 RepID=UPI001FCC8D13|nr:hypothetical protein [Mesorhizobium amorphae]
MVSSDIAKRQAASVYQKTLVDNGLLHEVKAGRENLYINPALMALLTERERKSAGEALFFLPGTKPTVRASRLTREGPFDCLVSGISFRPATEFLEGPRSAADDARCLQLIVSPGAARHSRGLADRKPLPIGVSWPFR